MTQQQLETRQRRALEAPWVIQRTAEGCMVYSAANPSRTYLVIDDGDNIHCTCPDFQAHQADPAWRCKHILAVQEKQRKPRTTEPEPGAEPPEGGPVEPPEQEPRVPRPPKPRKPRGNGNGAAHMLIKRSISPDGRIDAVSVEFSAPVNGAPVAEIKAQALRTLKLQNEIAAAFLNLNGNGKPKPQPRHRFPESEPPAGAQPNQDAIPARLLDVGTSNGRYGPRLFLSVQANGKRYRLYGSDKQLAAYVGYAGQQVRADELEPGLKLNIPCRVVLKEADNGFVNVTRVLRPVLPAQKGRQQWQPMPF